MRTLKAVAVLLAAALAPGLPAAETAASPGDRDFMRGRILYLQCRACHAVAGDEGEKIGPSLVNVFGRPAGTLAGFQGYSEALRKSGVVWDDATLDRWIRDPAAMVPGNLMAYAGLANDGDRALLIRYIRQVSGTGGRDGQDR